jgi:hypothetical protein
VRFFHSNKTFSAGISKNIKPETKVISRSVMFQDVVSHYRYGIYSTYYIVNLPVQYGLHES